MPDLTDLFTAETRVESAALRSIQARWFAAETDPHGDAESELADEELALAARDLVRAVDALPADRRPVGWGEAAR